jgi:SH3-like domain-containing protein
VAGFRLAPVGLLLAPLLVLAAPAAGAEFASIGADKVNLRQGPGTDKPRRFVVSRGYPLKILARQDGWAKVTDYEGDKAWVASRLLSDRRTVVVTKELVNVRSGPSSKRPVVFQAKHHVLLQYLGAEGNWVHVRHADGDEGWVYAPLVWGD